MKLTTFNKITTCMQGKTYNCSLDTNENTICGKNKLILLIEIGTTHLFFNPIQFLLYKVVHIILSYFIRLV